MADLARSCIAKVIGIEGGHLRTTGSGEAAGPDRQTIVNVAVTSLIAVPWATVAEMVYVPGAEGRRYARGPLGSSPNMS